MHCKEDVVVKRFATRKGKEKRREVVRECNSKYKRAGEKAEKGEANGEAMNTL